MLKNIVSFLLLAGVATSAQVAAPGGAPASSQPAPTNQSSPMPYSLSQSLGQLDQVAQSSMQNLGRLRVDKWKTDTRYKDQARNNVESLQKNLSAALPSLVQQVKANPGSLAAAVRLYRNLNAVYDVMASVTETAGAFGSKDDYNALATDTANLDNIRRSLADQLEQLAAGQDAQVARLSAQVQQAQAAAAAAAAAPPKRVIVDDTAPAKKPGSKKKPATPASTPKAQ
jgi:hypothetical protein